MVVRDTSEKTEQDMLAVELNLPKFEFKWNKWLAIISAIFSLFSFAFPFPIKLEDILVRIVIAICVLIVIFSLLTTLPWLFKVVKIMVKRVSVYPRLLNHHKKDQRTLAETTSVLTNYIQYFINTHSLKILRAGFVKEKFYIKVQRRAGYEVCVNDIIQVIDLENISIMGQFEVIELNEKSYYAEGISNLDLLWLGQVKKIGETSFFPNMISIHMPDGG